MSLAQKTCEFFPFVHLLGKLGCESYLEIGSRYGDSFLAIGSAMKKAVAVDLPGSHWGRPDSAGTLLRRTAALRDYMGVDAHVILGDSRDPVVIKKVGLLGPFDAVFIDGDHRYEGVKADWDNYGPLGVKAIGFHDIIGVGTVEVPRLWAEIKTTHTTLEYVETWGGCEMGIGVVIKPPTATG